MCADHSNLLCNVMCQEVRSSVVDLLVTGGHVCSRNAGYKRLDRTLARVTEKYWRLTVDDLESDVIWPRLERERRQSPQRDFPAERAVEWEHVDLHGVCVYMCACVYVCMCGGVVLDGWYLSSC